MRLVVKLALVAGILAWGVATAAAQVAQPIRIGGNIAPPTKIKDVAPVYPPEALAQGVGGVVILETTIGTDGAVTDATVLRHIALLDQAALDAVRQWVFTPTLLNGVPVPVIMTVTVNFPRPAAAPAPPTPPPTSPQVSGVTSGVPTIGRGLVVPPLTRPPASTSSFPAVTHVVKPGFPTEALAAGLTGTVSLDVTVDGTGAVIDGVCIDAARQWTFKPTTSSGIPTTHFAIGFIFSAQGGVQDTLRPITTATTASVGQEPVPPPAPGAPLRVGGNIKAPTKTFDARPVYPSDALQAHVTGVVIIEATISADGTVTDARVLRSIPLLDQAALDAVRQWRFTPTMMNGVPVPIIMTVTVNFAM